MVKPNTATESSPLLRPGETCWRLEQAHRVAIAIDSAAYFHAFREACEQARHSIFILGWDFDRRERLGRHRGAPRLGDFLCQLLRENPRLHIYLLLWDFHMVYAAERELFQPWRLRLRGHSRLHVQMDGCHPAGGSQHQKLVVIDDALAFCGGIDLSRWRWDTPDHKPGDPRRTDPDGKPYPPFHDTMLAVDGDAANALGELARTRWKNSGSSLEPLTAQSVTQPSWPESLKPLCNDQPVGIVRTFPRFNGCEAIREVENLYLESVAAARHSIYMENQYFTSSALADALEKRLGEADGPDVLMVLPHHTGGWLEQATMDVLRAALLERLQKADRYNRLRVYYPYQPGLGADCISVHAKLMIVDDRLLRVGSSNTSNRSMGLDSECDLAIEAECDTTRSAIAHLRGQLLAEHLDVEPEQIASAMAQDDGLIKTVASFEHEGRSLRPLPIERDAAGESLIPDEKLIDPDEPISANYFVNRFVPRSQQPTGKRRVTLFLGLVIALLGAAAAWRWTPLADWLNPRHFAAALQVFEHPLLRAAAVTGVFVGASLLMVPLTVLVIATALIVGAWQGFALALVGALISATIAFTLGHTLSRDVLAQLTGSRVERLSKRISKRGVPAVVILRLVPVAPFTVINLIAGASHLSPTQFMVGSALGLTPGILAVTLFSGSLYQAITNPGAASLGVLAVIVALLIGGVLGLRRLLRSSR